MAFLPSNFMFHSHDQEDDHSPSTSLNILPPNPYPYPSSHQDFHGSILMKRSMSFSTDNKYDHHHHQQPVIMNGDDDLSDDESQAGNQRKKIRLNLEQVKALEKSFEVGNKLEPDRKMQLARSLNMQPRQVAIWFQNRRARWKTKQLERDYDILKKQFDSIKADNDVLHAHNKKLHAELAALRNGDTTVIEAININRETDQGSWSNGSDQNSSDNHHHVNLNISTLPLSNNNNGSISSQLSFKQLFPSTLKPASITQLLQTSTRSDLHFPKNDQMGGQDENFCNMFCGIDEQPGLWPWTEQHHQL